MFDHLGYRAADLAAAERFYDTVLGAVGIARTTSEEFAEWDDFALGAATAERPPTRRLHLAFSVPSREHVDAFWAAGRAARYPDAGAPGERPQYSPSYYGAFLRDPRAEYSPGYYGAFVLDPDGSNIEAVHHG